MSVDDRGTHRSVEREHEDEGDARAQGRHRRGRRSSSPVSLAAVAEAEPLFTHEPDPEPALDAAIEPIVDLATSERSRRVVKIPSIDEPAPLVTPEPRLGIVGSFRRWWRDESLARAAHKRAYATAEAIVRARAVQDATQPLEKGPTPETYAQAVRGVLTLTEERFQSLGLRSDRLQDELRAISRNMTELHAIMVAGGLQGVGRAAATAVFTLEERFDALLVGLSDELRRRADESDRGLAEQLTTQSAELASMLERAVERIEAVFPDAAERIEERLHAMNERDLGEATDALRRTTTRELEAFRHVASEHIDRVRWAIPAEVERSRGASVEELVRIRTEIGALSRKLDEVIAGDPASTSAAGEGEDAAPR